MTKLDNLLNLCFFPEDFFKNEILYSSKVLRFAIKGRYSGFPKIGEGRSKNNIELLEHITRLNVRLESYSKIEEYIEKVVDARSRCDDDFIVIFKEDEIIEKGEHLYLVRPQNILEKLSNIVINKKILHNKARWYLSSLIYDPSLKMDQLDFHKKEINISLDEIFNELQKSNDLNMYIRDMKILNKEVMKLRAKLLP